MVSWDIEVRFLGMSPHIEELQILAEQEKFSNIEQIEHIEGTLHRLIVNNRGMQQNEFRAEVEK